MNRERHQYWASYIADVQGRMLLANWNVELVRPPARSSDGAVVVCIPGQCEARIRLNKNFDDFTRAEQRHFIVHELVHLHVQPFEYHLEMQNGGANDSNRYQVMAGHHSHEEYAVDQLARIIAPSMPLPPKVKA